MNESPNFTVDYLEEPKLRFPVFFRKESPCKIHDSVPFMPGCAFTCPTSYIWYGYTNDTTSIYIMDGRLL